MESSIAHIRDLPTRAADIPPEIKKQPWGRIAVANADSGAYAYANCAIDQAARAVRDLLGHSPHLPAYADFPGPPRGMVGLK